MFRGRYEHTMTDKGRVSVPSRFREVLKEKYKDGNLIITNFDKCLAAYPVEEWEEIEKKVAYLPQLKQEVISFLRYFISGAVECSIDGQGRILIPQVLRDYAQINRDVIMVGALTRFEVWAKEVWEEEFRKSHDEFKKSGDILAGLGL